MLDLWGEDTMSDYDDYMADVEQALRGVYSGAEGVLGQWVEDEERFVKDHLDLIKATYEAGYWDALDDVEENTTNLKRQTFEDKS